MADESNQSSEIEIIVERCRERIQHEMKSRSYRVANELRNQAQLVLRGARHGRRYRKPNTRAYYTASAPGEPPAIRTGTFRASWQPRTYVEGNEGNFSVRSTIGNDTRTENGTYLLGEILEHGTSRIAPRPYQEKILEKGRKEALRIYKEPYF